MANFKCKEKILNYKYFSHYFYKIIFKCFMFCFFLSILFFLAGKEAKRSKEENGAEVSLSTALPAEGRNKESRNENISVIQERCDRSMTNKA